jgi:STE24 endopeptidase
MRLGTILLFLLALFPAAAHAAPTPTEARAIAAAEADHTAYSLPPEELAKAEHISHLFDAMHFAGAAWGMLSLFLILQLGIAARMSAFAERVSRNRWVQSFVFLLAFLLLTTLLLLPLRMVAHHVSSAYGFSIQRWPGWFWDQTKSFLLAFGLEVPFVAPLFWLIRRFPRRWWLVLWAPAMASVLFGVYLSPLVVDPMFHQFEPLSQARPDLVRQLERVAANGHLDIPPDRMFLMKASEKTTLMNAYVTGFGGSKRLVIWDTLLSKLTPDEIAMVAGHEMGHYVLGHIVRGTLEAFAGILAAFFVGFHLFQWLLRRFGARWKIPSQNDWAALAVMLLVLNIVGFFAEPVSNALSRGMEHDADVFGQEVVHGIVADPQATGQAEEQLLGESSLVAPNPSKFVEFWTDSHPSTSFRAAFAKHYDPWAPGESPKYFPR